MTVVDRGRLWELFVEGLPDFAMILLDAEGKILSWNAGAVNMLGYSATEVVGRNVSCLYTHEDNAEGKSARSLERAVSQGQDVQSTRRVRRDGTVLEAEGLLIPLYDSKVLVGFGSVMRIPATLAPAVEAGAKAGSSNVSPPDSKKILIVDDNAQILDNLELQLAGLGYAVIRASSGDEALDILARASDVDLLLTDVVMPGRLNGGQLAGEARSIRPRLRILFTSGYFENDLRRDGVIDPAARVLAKPYRMHELERCVSEALSA
jgi:PAS domain S-box-containing protein